MLSKIQIKNFQKEILDWFAKNKRDLPWRKSRDPYSILISEVMLQQTQVSRVIPKFEAWMKEFPTIQDLAKASVRDILFFWSGLGYNRRALYLQKLAQEVVKNYKGQFSRDEKELRKLPGIGEYTARALLCFAFNKQITVVDTNVRKVILTKLKNVLDTPSEIQKIADMLLPKENAYEWNQALMDYASAELKKEKISLPKQSKFKDSDRYYRGQILKILLENKITREKVLLDLFEKKLEKERFEKILHGLEKDRFIKRNKGNLMLP